MINARTDCRCCRSKNLNEVFRLGDQPFANAFLRSEQLSELELKAPLIIMECSDCSMAQLSHIVDPTVLYREYSFVTGSSQWMTSHFAELLRTNIRDFVPRGGLVVEIGSNDGSALLSIKREGIRCIGVDPATNLAAIANDRGVTTLCDFFSEKLATAITTGVGQADLIVACNVLGHIDDLDDFCLGVKKLLAANGRLVVEVPYVRWLVSNNECDTIYHEHLSYFSVGAFVHLFHRFGLQIEKVESQAVHGGTIRVTAKHGTENASSVQPWIVEEKLDWTRFRTHCETMRLQLLAWLIREKKEGHVIWGYGAPAKGTVLLNYCGIESDLIPVVVDSTPSKQGKFVPGTHQPILNPEEVLKQMPSACLVLAWNHYQEIERKESAYKQAGGKLRTPFVTLFPTPNNNRTS